MQAAGTELPIAPAVEHDNPESKKTEWEEPEEAKPTNPFGRKTVPRPESGTRLSALEIHENIRGPAVEELERPASSLLFSSLAAGMLIGFSFLASAFVSHYAPEPYKHPLASLAYPIGFMFVIMGRSELFTENTLEPVIPLLHKRDAETFNKLLRMWGLLIVGNLIGALVFGWILGATNIIDAPLHPSMQDVARQSTEGGFGMVFYKAIFGGWLIALLAWLLASTIETTAQIFMIWVATAPISAFHFRHSIAGSVEAFYRAVTGAAGWGEMLGSFIVPSLLGNAVGGVLLVALFNYAQVAEEHATTE
ncbi:MAG TPA: formate/nitrite transporter family protein [Gemmatimonadaceae bacterium]|nr:formate/nitrite transporter family protein [Gemmatimonadaceae bacterium]